MLYYWRPECGNRGGGKAGGEREGRELCVQRAADEEV